MYFLTNFSCLQLGGWMIIDEKHNSFKDLFKDVAVYGYKGEQIDDDM